MTPTPQLLWSIPPKLPSLDETAIHIWCFALTRPASEVARLRSLLPADERARADRFVFDRDRNHFTVGRAILRTILGSYLQSDPHQLAFVYGPQGKPELQTAGSPPPLHFNLSHSGGLALLALSQRQPLGVDIEAIRPLDDMTQIARRFFAPEEVAALLALPASQQQQGFFNCWTRKEAYLKATGDGLRQPLDQFAVTLRPGEPVQLLHIQQDRQAAAVWSLATFAPASGYVGAIALPGQGWQIACWRWAWQ